MKQIENYLVEKPKMTKAIVAYALKNNKVLLGVRKTSSTNLGLNLVAGFGGKHEGEETDLEALLRELEEEAGIIPTKWVEAGNVIFLNPNNPKWNLDVAVFIVKEWEGEPSPSSEMEPAWFEIDQIPYERMFSDNQYWLPQVLEGKNVNAAFLFDKTGIVEHQVTFEER